MQLNRPDSLELINRGKILNLAGHADALAEHSSVHHRGRWNPLRGGDPEHGRPAGPHHGLLRLARRARGGLGSARWSLVPVGPQAPSCGRPPSRTSSPRRRRTAGFVGKARRGPGVDRRVSVARGGGCGARGRSFHGPPARRATGASRPGRRGRGTSIGPPRDVRGTAARRGGSSGPRAAPEARSGRVWESAREGARGRTIRAIRAMWTVHPGREREAAVPGARGPRGGTSEPPNALVRTALSGTYHFVSLAVCPGRGAVWCLSILLEAKQSRLRATVLLVRRTRR